jgi:hypothetical protein
VTEELGAPKKFAKERQVGVGILHLLDELGVVSQFGKNRTIVRRETAQRVKGESPQQ